MEILCSFTLVLEEKKGKEMPESSRLKFVENFLANNFVLSGVEGKTSGSLNGRGIAELPLLRTLLAIRQRSREPSFWEVMDSFVLVAYENLENFKNPFATIINLSELYFRFRRFIVGTNEKRDFYELWQHHKMLNTMEMSEV